MGNCYDGYRLKTVVMAAVAGQAKVVAAQLEKDMECLRHVIKLAGPCCCARLDESNHLMQISTQPGGRAACGGCSYT